MAGSTWIGSGRASARLRRVAAVVLARTILAAMLGASAGGRAAVAAPPAWIRVETAHYTFFSEGDEPSTLDLARSTERLHEVLERITGVSEPSAGSRTVVMVFRSIDSFAPYRLTIEGEPDESAGYLLRRDDGSYIAYKYSNEDDQPVVYHEHFHDFADGRFPDLPPWLNEGLAEFYSTFDSHEDTALVGRPLGEHVAWLARNPLIPLSELIQADNRSLSRRDNAWRHTFYAQSWLLVHELMLGSASRHAQFGAYLESLASGDRTIEGLESAFGTTASALEEELRAYAKKGDFHFSKITFASSSPPGTDGLRATRVPPAELMARLGDLSLRENEEVSSFADEHYRAALRWDPGCARALAGLAYTRSLEKRSFEADELFRRAIAADPADSRTHFLFGRSLFEEVGRFPVAPETAARIGRELLMEARESFAQSVALEPTHVEALIGLGRVELLLDPAGSNAISPLTRALQLDPTRGDAAISLSRAYLNAGDPNRARAVLETLIARSRDHRITLAANRVLIAMEINEGLAICTASRLEEGVAILHGVLPRIEDPALRGQVTGEIARAEAAIAERKLVATYNEAVGLVKKGAAQRARPLLQRVAAETTRPALRDAAKKLLDKLEAVPRPGPAKRG